MVVLDRLHAVGHSNSMRGTGSSGDRLGWGSLLAQALEGKSLYAFVTCVLVAGKGFLE
jgi:hypothetical protein